MISFIKSISKELVNLFRKIKRTILHNKIINTLDQKGIYVKENFITKKEAKMLKTLIDDHLNSKKTHWSDNLNSDKRIYFSDRQSTEFKKLYNNAEIRNTLINYLNIKNPKGFLLASRLDSVEGNLGSGGGWHKDSSHDDQFKVILYLSDVKEQNGPFEYIEKSHCFINSIKLLVHNMIKPNQKRIPDSDILPINNKLNTKIKTLCAKAGTAIFVNTKGIHRGKPINVGTRHSLTWYFWKNEIPEHFLKELPSSKIVV